MFLSSYSCRFRPKNPIDKANVRSGCSLIHGGLIKWGRHSVALSPETLHISPANSWVRQFAKSLKGGDTNARTNFVPIEWRTQYVRLGVSRCVQRNRTAMQLHKTWQVWNGIHAWERASPPPTGSGYHRIYNSIPRTVRRWCRIMQHDDNESQIFSVAL